jgi:hypothetical protein
MKRTTLYLVASIICLITFSGCRKEVAHGNVMFWTDQNEGNVTVTISNQSGVITGFVTGGVPNCGNAVSTTFYLEVGNYAYTATAPASPAYPQGYSLTGNALAVDGQCQAYQL